VATITVSAVYPVTPDVVWQELRHIERHVKWMSDAVAIEFLGDQREGVGTSFRCTTKVGPFKTEDLMAITLWVQDTVMGVEHRGIVKGSGAFTLAPAPGGTLVTWSEELTFPWWALGPFGSFVASPVLRALWVKNLKNLGQLLA
jgi:hypothetical protein